MILLLIGDTIFEKNNASSVELHNFNNHVHQEVCAKCVKRGC